MAELRFKGSTWPVPNRRFWRLPCRWYATYTAPRHEKSVLQHLESRSVESYLPLYGSTRLWNGRRAFVQLPLFPGYLFVRIAPEHRVKVLEVPGVLSIVSSQGRLDSVTGWRGRGAARRPGDPEIGAASLARPRQEGAHQGGSPARPGRCHREADTQVADGGLD